MKKIYTLAILLIVSFLFTQSHVWAQEEEKKDEACSKEKCAAIEFSTGMDLVSSYNWRAVDFGNSPAIQPYMSLAYHNFEFIGWGSYALIAQEDVDGKLVPFNEIDLVLKYKHETEAGTFGIELTDFFYPFAKMRFSDFKGVKDDAAQGAHWISGTLRYTGGESFPIGVAFDCLFHNDPDLPMYFELSYPVKVGDLDLGFVVGAGKGKNKADLYSIEDDKIAIVNAGVTLTKTVTLSKEFSFPLSTSFVMNPYTSQAHVVLKISL